jgi:uncharacterized protein YqeY
MKAGDKRRLSTVRMIQAALEDKDIEARGCGRARRPTRRSWGSFRR